MIQLVLHSGSKLYLDGISFTGTDELQVKKEIQLSAGLRLYQTTARLVYRRARALEACLGPSASRHMLPTVPG